MDRDATLSAAAIDAATKVCTALGLPKDMLTVAPGQTLATIGSTGLATLPASLPAIAVSHDHHAGTSAGSDLTIEDTIGEGGMAIVYRARQHSLGRNVAIKSTRGELRDRSSAAVLIREARITGQLEHPNVVPIHMLGVDPDGAPAIVMKRVEGVPWSTLIADPKHPFWRFIGPAHLGWHIETLMQVCQAIDFAHDRGVVHRDLKPDNVMIGRFGEVYVLDWGIAVDVGTEVTTLAGTPAYMAPEMLGEGVIDERTDVYLLGAVLHELLTGKPPHTAKNLIGAICSVSAGDVTVPRDEQRPSELCDVCDAVLKSDPAERPESVRALRTALAQWQEHRESNALTAEALGRLEQLEASVEAPGSVRRLGAMATECRFAFKRALNIWPQNQRARDGLDTVLQWMVEQAIARAAVERARELFEELAESPTELDARIAALGARLEAEAAEVVALRESANDLDLTQLASRRARFLAIISAIIVVSGGLLIAQKSMGRLPGIGVMILSQGGLLGLVVVGASLERVRRNKANRELLFGFFAVAAGALLVRTLCWQLGISLDSSYGFELILYFVTATVVGVMFERALLAAALFFGLGVAAGLAFPGIWLEVTTTAGLLGLMAVTITWRRLPPGPDSTR